MRCADSPRLAGRSRARPTTESRRRSTCETRTETASSSTVTGPRRSGRARRTARAFRCTTRPSTSTHCWRKPMPKGYAEGPAAEEAERRLEELERGGGEPRRAERLAGYGPPQDDPARHFLGRRAAVEPDALFATGTGRGC